MCEVFTTAALTGLGFGGATAAGATAAAGVGSTLQTLATLAAIGGTAYQGISTYRANQQNAAAVEQQRATEAQLRAVEDMRERRRFRGEIAQQRAEYGARGVSLDSPTAIFLGESAAREMTFASQSIRQTGQARDQELTNQGLLYQSRATSALIGGGLSAAGTFLDDAVEQWPELLS